MPRTAPLALLLAACAKAPSEPPPPAEQVCATMRNMTACCPVAKRTRPAVFASREACEADRICKGVTELDADFATHDVVLATPTALGMTYEQAGPPTSLGDEWNLYFGVDVTCTIPAADAGSFHLLVGTDAGGGTVAYVREVPKLGGAVPTCACGPLPR